MSAVEGVVQSKGLGGALPLVEEEMGVEFTSADIAATDPLVLPRVAAGWLTPHCGCIVCKVG